MFTAEMIRAARIRDAVTTFSPDPRSYVVVVPYKGRNGVRERVAYGRGYSLTERAAKRLARSLAGLYGSKPRAIMVKTAAKDSGILF